MRARGFAVAILFLSSFARAGGFETPDNGTEALGRGGAFTAKASDGTALEYNVAGFANQRGTRVLLDGKLNINNYTFARAGVYPDPDNTSTPWGNHFFPTVTNQGGPFFAPFLGVSSDFGYFDKLTFAAGAFGPSGVGNPYYPYSLPGGVPSPSRYDVVAASSSLILPTGAVAYRVSDWLDVGAAFHYVIASFNLANTSFLETGPPNSCPTPEYYGCDTFNQLSLSGSTFTGSGGVLLHPADWLDMGLNIRGPITVNAAGTVQAFTHGNLNSSGSATLQTSLPWNIRVGARIKFMDGDYEQGDLEFDTVYEPWGSSANGGNVYVSIPSISGFTNVDTIVRNNFQDVYSLRFGGAYNIRTGGSGVFTLRAGGYYESPSTLPQDTRLDFNTLEKYAGTIGAGFSIRGVGFNVAFAEIVSPERVVTNGDLAPVNPAQHGLSIDGQGNPLPVVNNGIYTGSIQMLSFGVRVEWETLFGTKRSKRWSPQGTMAYDGTPAKTETAPAPKEEDKTGDSEPDPSKGGKGDQSDGDTPEPSKGDKSDNSDDGDHKKPSEPKKAADKPSHQAPPKAVPPPPKKAAPPPPPPPPKKVVPPPPVTKPEDDPATKRLEDPFAT
jgi:long-subunit fatty acid transport protein